MHFLYRTKLAPLLDYWTAWAGELAARPSGGLVYKPRANHPPAQSVFSSVTAYISSNETICKFKLRFQNLKLCKYTFS